MKKCPICGVDFIVVTAHQRFHRKEVLGVVLARGIKGEELPTALNLTQKEAENLRLDRDVGWDTLKKAYIALGLV